MRLLNSTLIACAVIGSVLIACPARAGDSLLVMRSEPGDWLGQGQTLALGPNQGSFTSYSDSRNGFYVRFQGPGHFWSLTAQRGRWNPFVPGIYGVARDFVSSGDTLPRFEISGDGRGCGDSPGYFDVRQIAYDGPGVARRLRVFFEYHCGGAAPALMGELRIDADTTLTVNVPLHLRARRGQALALPVSAIHAGGLPFALTAGPLPPGASFIDNGNGTGQMNWTPGIVQQGDFEFAFTASDGFGKTDVAHTLVRVDGDTLLDATSEPGDRTWPGRNCRLRPGDMWVQANGSGHTVNLAIYPIGAAVGTRYFTITPIAPGNYSVLRRWSDNAFADGQFLANQVDGACGGLETHYRVRRVEIGPTFVSKLWVEWEQHCDGEAPAFGGEMRINSGSPIVAYAPIARRVHYGDTLRFQVSGRDTLGRSLVLSALALPSGCTFTSTSLTTADVSWSPSEGAAGPHRLMFRAINSAGEADTVTTDVVVTGDVSASIVSEPGDPAGNGETLRYNGLPGGLLTANLVSNSWLGTTDALDFYDANHAWHFKIRGPEGAAGAAILDGRYSVPWPPPYNSTYFTGSSASGRSGEWLTTDFRLRQLQRSNGNLTRLWLQFEQRSEDRMPILYGDIRIDARWRVLARAPLHRAATVLQPIDFEVRGETPDGEIPVISTVSMPSGAYFKRIVPGRATFHWVPDETSIGNPKTVGFVATRSDGTTDTSWTVLEALPWGVMHIEESGHTWDLNSNLGQLRSLGEAPWARATFSSPAADTVWSVDIYNGSNDTLRTQSYFMTGDLYGPNLCLAVPGNSYFACNGDSGRFEVSRITRTAAGPPSQLWADFDQAHWTPESRRFGWVRLGSAGVLSTPLTPALPLTFECSQFLPNPAMSARRIELRLPRAGEVSMAVYDVSGRRVREQDWGVLVAGQHSLQPSGLDALPVGLYLVRIEYAGQRVMRRLSVLR